MHLSNPLRSAALVAACATAVATLAVAPPASATPVFTDADTVLAPYSSYFNSGPGCTVVGVNDTHPDVPIAENGPVASTTAAASATYNNTGTPADTGTWTAQMSATGKVTSVGGNPRTFDFSAQATFALSNALGTSADCGRGGYVGVDFTFTFTVTQAGFLHLDFAGSGLYGRSEVYIYQDLPIDQPSIDHSANRQTFNESATVLLTPGTYKGFFESEAFAEQKSSAAGSVATTVHGQFNVAGAQTAAVTGKAKKYVTLPGARTCASHSINASVVGKKKSAGQIKQVNVFVNDAKVKKVKTPDKGDAVTIPVADDQAAEVRAEVTLFPRKKGKPGKVVEVTASYEACS